MQMGKSKETMLEEMFEENLDNYDDPAAVKRLAKEKDFSLYYDVDDGLEPSLEELGLDSYAYSTGNFDFD